MQANQVTKSKPSAYSQVKALYNAVLNTANIQDSGYTSSHTAVFVCVNRPIQSDNIDTNAFCQWAHTLTGIKYTTIERYLRQFKAIDKC